ncbi:MAG: alpha-amylase family glycosyl hydrolase, partial [Rheinheimera sp.]|nr:alpha-amylase family glycosyl hydrolase [Rheinheimera sp.]
MQSKFTIRWQLLTVVIVCLISTACSTLEQTNADHAAQQRYQPQPYVRLTHPEWSKNAAIYQINTRQFTAEGTFAAAAMQLPRLKQLGVSILWLMPVQPIGEVNRKGELGSPYSIKDYYGVNSEFGSKADLKAFIAQAHALGMYVILDWVANHTAWDNTLVKQHPDWYLRDWKGDFTPTPWW